MLDGMNDIAICNLTAKDAVRRTLVQKIINAYDKFERSARGSEEAERQRRR